MDELENLRLQYEELMEKRRAADFRAEILNKMYWLTQKGDTIAEFFKINHISRVILYGYGQLGRITENELNKHGIEIVGAIDKNAGKIQAAIEIQTADYPLPVADMVLVTSDNLDEVKRYGKLYNWNIPVISIKNVLNVLEN